MKRVKKPNAPRLGQPPKMQGGRRVNVYLDTATLERARKLGKGNLSEGIRRAVIALGSSRIAPAQR